MCFFLGGEKIKIRRKEKKKDKKKKGGFKSGFFFLPCSWGWGKKKNFLVFFGKKKRKFCGFLVFERFGVKGGRGEGGGGGGRVFFFLGGEKKKKRKRKRKKKKEKKKKKKIFFFSCGCGLEGKKRGDAPPPPFFSAILPEKELQFHRIPNFLL
ncbi:MAG: hypothetical protein IPH24_07630 [Crocinitomicaceae bacterium]|nr:hypothetical protein [Crocinitomicaceae bacterium]